MPQNTIAQHARRLRCSTLQICSTKRSIPAAALAAGSRRKPCEISLSSHILPVPAHPILLV